MFFIPLTCYWFINNNWVLVSSQVLFILALNIKITFASHYQILALRYTYVVITLSFTLFLTVFYLGYQALFWTFPILVTFYFIFPLKKAHFYSFIIVLPISIFLFINYDAGLAIRYSVSISLTLFLGSIIVRTILDLQQQLLEQSITDPLTGALNRRQMDLMLENKIQQNQRQPNESCIIILDIDFFKKVNDQYGHNAGDKVLINLVQVLKSYLRKSDLIFRIGGEEFLVLLSDTSIKKAELVAEQLRVAVEKIHIEGSQQYVSASFGVAAISVDITAKSWLQAADLCLYAAKAQGRNRVISNTKIKCT